MKAVIWRVRRDHRHGPLAERRDGPVAFGAGRGRLGWSRGRHFGIEMILEDVQSAWTSTEAAPGPVFREAVDVVRLDSAGAGCAGAWTQSRLGAKRPARKGNSRTVIPVSEARSNRCRR